MEAKAENLPKCDLIRKMWKRGKSIREIAEDFEEDETLVEGIVEGLQNGKTSENFIQRS